MEHGKKIGTLNYTERTLKTLKKAEAFTADEAD